jgi:hypothetical protein
VLERMIIILYCCYYCYYCCDICNTVNMSSLVQHVSTLFLASICCVESNRIESNRMQIWFWEVKNELFLFLILNNYCEGKKMNEASLKLAEQFISSSYIKMAIEARNQRENCIKNLLATVFWIIFIFYLILQSTNNRLKWSESISLIVEKNA